LYEIDQFKFYLHSTQKAPAKVSAKIII